jgi:hypothetical protein
MYFVMVQLLSCAVSALLCLRECVQGCYFGTMPPAGMRVSAFLRIQAHKILQEKTEEWQSIKGLGVKGVASRGTADRALDCYCLLGYSTLLGLEGEGSLFLRLSLRLSLRLPLRLLVFPSPAISSPCLIPRQIAAELSLRDTTRHLRHPTRPYHHQSMDHHTLPNRPRQSGQGIYSGSPSTQESGSALQFFVGIDFGTTSVSTQFTEYVP